MFKVLRIPFSSWQLSLFNSTLKIEAMDSTKISVILES